jgi:hypothetical protein
VAITSILHEDSVMTQQINHQLLAFTKQFADSAFKAQSMAMKGLETVADLQRKAFERQASASAAFVAEAMEAKDMGSLQGLWGKGASMGRESAEQTVSVSQEIMAITQKVAESMGALVQQQCQAANDAVSAPMATAKKAASK